MPKFSLSSPSSAKLTALLFASLVLVGLSPGQSDPPKPPASPYKPYSEVVTAGAKTQEGLFKVHQAGDKWLFEIPPSVLDRDMLWQAQETTIPITLGSPGVQDSRLVRWQRRGKMMYLMGVDYTLRSKDSSELGQALRTVLPPAVLEAFAVQSEGPNGEAVVDVTDFLLSDPADMNIGQSWNAALQRNRSYVERIRAFPTNVEMKSLLTFRVARQTVLTGSDSGNSGSVGPYASILMHYSFLMLPERPMAPRYRDPRVGFFGIQLQEFGGADTRGVVREIVKRFRLEKRDPGAAVSEPVKPIVFYLSSDMPRQWRPYARRAVEAWRPAFEQAGFRNAIEARDEPVNDPEFDREDARFSMIRWTPGSIENAFGLAIVDPRSGEIISGQVIFYHAFLSWLQNLYFVQASPLDPAARKLPFPEALMGKLFQFIVTHEVGHSIGLEHNMKASSAYTVANLRDPAFVRKNDIASSIMDYARFNWVAQPGDGVPLERGIGTYDRFAVEWGYSVADSSDEAAHLQRIASRQNDNPFLRFGNYVHPEDPRVIGEDLTNDPIAAARLGYANLRRAAKYLVPASVLPHEDYRQLATTYAAMVRHQEQFLDSAIRLVGGVEAEDHHMAAGKPIYAPIPKARQREAVRFVCGPEAAPPAEMLAPEIVGRLFAAGDVRREMNFQYIVLFSLFQDNRIQRLLDQELALGEAAYTVKEMLADTQNAVWSALRAPKPTIGLAQRQLQRSYLAVIDAKLNGTTANRTEFVPLARASLVTLATRLVQALPRASNEATQLHLKESKRLIQLILSGQSAASKLLPPPAAPPPRTSAKGGCWGP